MGKTYIEAQYRIKDTVYNHGYICIDKNNIKGLFTCDLADIQNNNGSINFCLIEFLPEFSKQPKVKHFVGYGNIESAKLPHCFILKSSSNEVLSLELIKKITDINRIPDIGK